ncbi:TolC family outer membrane protein [Thiomicrorhabdus indica]|uniref:TolC family outer membrane protein n=1 Tax=Thiomicrorhabdus indica TaxID=2267253 RepID=UPI00102DF765|nr:TolC family outer membrane protein [Thiomicrorhabdus indica]
MLPLNKVLKKKITNSVLVTAMSLALPAAASANGLVDIFQMALQNDPLLAQSKAQLEADKQSIRSIKGGLYPQITASGQYNDIDSPSADYNSSQMAVTLNQSIYQHEVWSRYDQAKTAIQTSELSVAIAEQNLILSTAQAYFDVLLAKQNLQLFKTKEASDLTQLESAQASAEVGLASRVDVLQAQSSYDLSRSERISAENALDISLEALAKLTGKRFDENQLNELLMSTSLPSMHFDIDKLQMDSSQNNLAVLQAKAQLEVALQEIEVQKSGFWPTVNFQASLSDTQYSNGSGAQAADGTTSSFGVNVSMPLYSGGSTTANVKSSEASKEASQQGLRETIDSAKLDARTLSRNIEQGVNLIQALREAVKSNDAFLEAAEEGYKVGLKDMLEVLSARTNQVQARKNLIEALHNQVLNMLQLEAVLGDLTVEDLQRFDKFLQIPVTS